MEEILKAIKLASHLPAMIQLELAPLLLLQQNLHQEQLLRLQPKQELLKLALLIRPQQQLKHQWLLPSKESGRQSSTSWELMEREPDSEVTDVPESMIEYKLFICT